MLRRMEGWICPDCGARSTEGGPCPACGEGPRLDLGHPETEHTLRERDRLVVDRRVQRVTAIAVVAGIVGGGAVGLAMPRLLPIPFGGAIQGLVAMVLGAAAVRTLLLAIWPPPRRFAFLDEGLTASIRGDATAMKLSETKKIAFVLLGLSVVGAAISLFVHFQNESAARAEIERRQAAGLAWANLWQCTLGGFVTSDEVPTRMRLIDLGNPPEGWPRACSEHAMALFERLDDRDFGVGLKQELRDRFGCEGGCTVDQPAAQFVGLRAPSDLPPVAPTVAGPPQIDARLLDKGAFAGFGGGDARVIARDVAHDGAARLLLASRSRGHAFCEVAPAEGTVACDSLALPVTESTLRLVAGGREPVLLGRERALAPEQSFSPDGSVIATYAGRHDGHAIVRLEDRVFEIALVREGEPAAQKKLKLAEGAQEPILAASHVIWIDGEEPTLFARPLGGDDLVGERIIVGPLAEASPPRLCAAGELTAVLVGPASGRQSIAFHAGGTWHRPLEVPSATSQPAEPSATREAEPQPPDQLRASEPKKRDRTAEARPRALRDVAEFGMIGILNSGAGGDPDAPTAPWGRDDARDHRPIFGDRPTAAPAKDEAAGRPTATLASARPHLPRQSLICGEGHATLTWRDEIADRIHQVRCTPERCQHRSVALALKPRSWWHATSIGDRTLILWRGAKGELRMRFDAIEKLPAARDVMVMDSAEYGGPEAVDLEAFTSDRGAVFWFRGLGFHALAIDAEGHHRAIGG
jgi:hypothetical protein